MIATGFTGGWLDRADHLRNDAVALAEARADPRTRLLQLPGGDPAIDGEGRLIWSAMAALDGEPVFLGLSDGIAHFVELRADHRGGGVRSPGLFRMLDLLPADEAAVFGAARSLIDWHARHPFCAGCGATTDFWRGGWARRCTSCGAEHFPRVDPVVIMLAEHDGRALVGRGAAWPAGRYSALAGFVEPGESIEEAVARELFEESGVRVRDVRYIASQPWPFPGQLMIGAFATADNDALNIDTNELETAMWVTRDEVRAALAGEAAPFLPPPRYAIAHTLLAEWVK